MSNLYIIDNKASRSSVFGIGTYINELGKSLQQSDLQPCFIHLNSDRQRFFQEIEDGVPHWYFPLPKLKYKDDEKHNKLYFQNVVFVLRQYIKPTDHLIFHLNYLHWKPFADELKAAFNCKIVLAVHFLSWCFDILGNVTQLQNIIGKSEDDLDQLSRQVRKSFNEEKTMLCSVDKVISLSKHTTYLLQYIYNTEEHYISTIYNGLEDKVYKKFDRIQIRKKFHLPVKMSVIIFAGRLDPVKGLSYFIQASKIVLNQFPNCHIIVAGSGDYQTCMKECGNRWMNIHFTGQLEKSELYELYSIADFGVMPSFHEQCSYVAIEMMMHSLPIIASTSTGLSEMIDEGITGLHVPVNESEYKIDIDISLLAEKMLYLLQHPTERKRMGTNARKRYEQLYSSEKMRKNMLNFYKSLFNAFPN